MKLNSKLRILFYCLIFLTSYLKGQNIQFSHLSTSDKLSHVSVVTLYVDEYNSIWIGTREGLNRYDGLNVETYTLQENDTHSLFSNNIQKLAGDRNGHLFIQTTEGVSAYDLAKNTFTTLWQDNHIKAMCYQDGLYVGRNREIYKYDSKNKKFNLQHTLPREVGSITSLLVDSLSNTLYAGTNIGLYSISKVGKIQRTIVTNSNVSSIYRDEDDELWVSTWNDGVFRMSKNGIKQFTHQPNNPNSIASNFVRDCCQDDLGNIWIATFVGLNKYNKKTGQFSLIVPNKKPDGLSHSSVWSIVKDHQGSLWLGTYFGGVNYFNPEHVIYTLYEQSRIESEGLSSSIVGRMTEDNRGNLWICTEGAGVNVYNRHTGKFKWYLPHKGDNSISQNNVKAIHYDKDEDAMWFGTHLGALDKLDLKTGVFSHFRHDPNNPKSIPSNIVRDIVAHDRKLYLSTDNGVGVLDIKTGECDLLLTDSDSLVNNTFDLHFDHQGNLWIAVMGEGVYRYEFDTKKLTNYRHIPNQPNSLSNNNIISIAEDSQNILYFCTSGRGFDSFNPVTGEFKNYDSQKNNLIGNFVYNIVEAAPDDYLIITNLGLSRFNPRTKKIRNYNANNNFPLSNVNDNALYLAANGEVFLGGVDGLVSFNINDLDFTAKGYDIRFSRLYVNSKEVEVDDDTDILKQSLFKTSSIKLDASYNTFEVEVATTNYIPSNTEGLIYQLKGFSEEWLPLRDSKITYTNLDAGKYTLIVKNDTYNDDTAEKLAQLKIEILPPFYKSPIAYIVYIVLILLVGYYFIRSYDNRIKLQASLAYEQKHLHDVELLNQSKLRFFTNISHEFRTPLTVIIGQLDNLINKHHFTSDVYDKILSVYKNSIQMRDLISELLDFRKQEQGHMTISAGQHNIVEFVKENYLLFEEYANTKNITFTFNSDVDSLPVWYDSRQLQKVMNNLISNAFKHTPVDGTITLSLVHDDVSCSISVADSGNGIKAEEAEKIFERFYQVDDQSNSGSGIGLALSMGIVKLHHGELTVKSDAGYGAVFKMTLPLGNKHLSVDSINQSEDVDKAMIKPLHDFITHQTDRAGVAENASNKDVKILIVEDNDDLRNMLKDLFTSIYDVIVASDGKEGLELVHQEQPDIILSDIVMPNMTGIELCKAVKTDINICHIPLILLTAKTSVEHNIEGLGIGADDYITKPFDAELLMSRCNNLIMGRRLLQQVFSQQPDLEPIQLATNSLDKELIQQAIDIVEKNLDNIDFGINDFCKGMGMSRTNLFTKIKALTNQTPNAFIMTIRLKKAAQLLRQRLDLNITEISVITGFNTSHYFSKCFKEAYQKTPTEFREGK